MKNMHSANTTYQYEKTLGKLKRNNIDIKKYNSDKLLLYIQKYASSTQNGYISAVLHALKDDNEPRALEYKKILKNKIIDTRITINNDNMSKIMTDTEIKKFVKWETIIKIYNCIEQYVKNEKNVNFYARYAILSLYVLNPPRRILDYANMYYANNIEINLNEVIDMSKICDANYLSNFKWIEQRVFSMDDTEFDIEEQNNDKNYYVAINDDRYFVFENYKTCKVYNRQVLKLDKKLASILNKYCELIKINFGDKLFTSPTLCENEDRIKTGFFSEGLITMFKSIIDRQIGASTLRHVFLMNFFSNNPTPAQKQIVSLCMAHTMEQQDKYVKNGSYDTIDDDVIQNGVYKYFEKKKKIKNKIAVTDNYINMAFITLLVDNIKKFVFFPTKKGGKIYKICANNNDKNIYIGSTFAPLQERFEHHMLACNDKTHIYFKLNYEKMQIHEIETIEVSSRTELTLIEDYYILKYDTIQNGLNTKLNNDIMVKMSDLTIDYNTKNTLMNEYVIKYHDEKTKYLIFLNANLTFILSYGDFIKFDDKQWCDDEICTKYVSYDLLNNNVKNIQTNPECSIHGKNDIMTFEIKNNFMYDECLCADKNLKINQYMCDNNIYGMYILFNNIDSSFLLTYKYGGTSTIITNTIHYEAENCIIRYIMDKGIENCKIKALMYYKFSRTIKFDIIEEYLTREKKMYSKIIKNYEKHMNMNDIVTLTIIKSMYENVGKNTNKNIDLYVKNKKIFNITSTELYGMQKFSKPCDEMENHNDACEIKINNTSIVNKIKHTNKNKRVNKQSEEEYKNTIVSEKIQHNNDDNNELFKVSNEEEDEAISETPICFSNKIGRPAKYTEEGRKKAKEETLRKCRDKRKELIKLYNKQYYQKLKSDKVK